MLKDLKMGEIKLGIYIFYILGYGTWIAGIMANIDNAKSVILFIAGLIFAGYTIANKHLDYIKKRDDFREEKKRRKSNNPKMEDKL